jgi:hypothetical protein
MYHRGPALVAVVLLATACTSGGQAIKGTTTTTKGGTPTTTSTLPTVLTSVTVPANWNVGYDVDCPENRGPGAIYLGFSNGSCLTNGSGRFPEVAIAPLQMPPSTAPAPHITTINDIVVWSFASSDGLGSYLVLGLGVELTLEGPGAAGIIKTLTYSPAVAVLAQGAAPAVPSSWKRVTGGDVEAAVPGAWNTVASDVEGPVCGAVAQVESDTVVLDSDALFGPRMVLACLNRRSTASRFAPADGLEIDLHPQPGWPPSAALGRCLDLQGVTACPYLRTSANDRIAEPDVLFVKVTVPGHASEMLEIGLAGNGMVARTILYSLQAA